MQVQHQPWVLPAGGRQVSTQAPEHRGQPPGPIPVTAAVVMPLAGIGLVYGLWWISDRLVVVGPFDRAALGWVVIAPLWLLLPVLSGFAWRNLDPRNAPAVAAGVGLSVMGVAAFLWWEAIAHPDCRYGTTQGPAAWALSSLLLGLGIGAGVSVGGMTTRAFIRDGHPYWALPVGSAVGLFVQFLGAAAAWNVLLFGQCNRPA